MPDLAHAYRLLEDGLAELRAVVDSPMTSDDELLSTLTVAEGVVRRADQATVSAVAVLGRRGVFAERGYKSAAHALSDLLGWDGFEARRRTVAAEQVHERVEIDGSVLPARLLATTDVFATGQATLRHVDVIAALLRSPTAGRLAGYQWDGAERELAAKTAVFTPSQLRTWGKALLEWLDQDGAAPDDVSRPLINELHVRHRKDGRGGTISGRFEDESLFEAIVAVIDAKSKPFDTDDDRGIAQRQAEALADACAHLLAHADHDVLPDTGGRRPQLHVHIRLEDLENRARAASLDFGGTLDPQSLRLLACDAAVIPIVLNGAGQPLDVGRATRTIPDGLRRAVTARDRGCAHPSCDRPPSWTDIHHIEHWEHGGATRLDNLVMLCRAHHRMVHHSGWVVRIRDGLPEFIPPGWIDSDQVPRRNPRQDFGLVGVG